MVRTLREWAQFLPLDIQSRWIANVPDFIGRSGHILHCLINDTMHWCETPEGDAYWLAVWNIAYLGWYTKTTRGWDSLLALRNYTDANCALVVITPVTPTPTKVRIVAGSGCYIMTTESGMRLFALDVRQCTQRSTLSECGIVVLDILPPPPLSSANIPSAVRLRKRLTTIY